MNINTAEPAYQQAGSGLSLFALFDYYFAPRAGNQPAGWQVRPDPSTDSGSVRLNNFAFQNYRLTDLNNIITK
jgi:hypothetical protein